MSAGAARTIPCASCGAPAALSIASTKQRCPSCHAELVLPVEVKAHLYATQQLIGQKLFLASTIDVASGKVKRAEGGALLFVVGAMLCMCGGAEALVPFVVISKQGFDHAWPNFIVPPLGGLAVAVGMAVLVLVVHRFVRRGLRRTFAAVSPEVGAPHGSCHACGGPLPQSNAGSVRCSYCGCDNLLGRDMVVLGAVDLQARLVSHADDMLKAMNRTSSATTLLGYSTLIFLPLFSGGAWLLLARLFDAY